ncbi:MAG: BON domain-containing protein [Methylococcaceae bacterium]|nr:BON domain-containing protein [Methylococcaceae bacterium]
MNITHLYKHNNLGDSVVATVCLVAALGLAGCKDEGPAEKAGKKIDSAKENVEQNIKQLSENADKKIEATKEALDTQADKVTESINQSTDASKEALEEAGAKIDQAAENAEKKIESAKESIIEKSATAGEYIDDSVITMDVKAALSNDSILKATPSQISVTTVNGVVTLSGTVDAEPSIGRAMEVASSQKNVKSVQIELTVKPSAASIK